MAACVWPWKRAADFNFGSFFPRDEETDVTFLFFSHPLVVCLHHRVSN